MSAVRYGLFPVVLIASLAIGVLAIGHGISPLIAVPPIVLANVAILALAERWLPYEPRWNKSHGDVRTDWLHMIASNLAAPEIYKAGLLLALTPAAAAIRGALGWSPWPSHWPLAVQLVLALVVAEAGQYWAHRLAHERDFLWRLHAVHHSPERLYWLNAGRDHPLGVLLLFGSEMTPLILLGADEHVFALFALATAVIGLFQHCNVDIRLGPLNWIFSLNEVHRWHHSIDVAEANHNYGSNLIVWDVVFGTRYLPDDRRGPEKIGIGDMPHFPRDWLGQLAVPFVWRRLRRLP